MHTQNAAFAQVRKGVYKLTGRKCALKFVDKAETTHRRFLREAQYVAAHA
jgi:serine/threonine protein kinase